MIVKKTNKNNVSTVLAHENVIHKSISNLYAKSLSSKKVVISSSLYPSIWFKVACFIWNFKSNVMTFLFLLSNKCIVNLLQVAAPPTSIFRYLSLLLDNNETLSWSNLTTFCYCHKTEQKNYRTLSSVGK